MIAANHELEHKAAQSKAEDSLVACHLAVDTYVNNVQYSQLAHKIETDTSNRIPNWNLLNHCETGTLCSTAVGTPFVDA